MTQTETDLRLSDGFDGRDEAAWLKAIERVLKGADFEKRLVSKTADGVALQPLYMQAADKRPLPATQPGRPWHVAQRVDDPEVGRANRQAIDDLMNGADTLSLVFSDSFAARGFGLALAVQYGLHELLDVVLRDLSLEMVTLRLEPGFDRLPTRAVAELVARRGHAPADVQVHFGLAPLAQLMATGKLPADWQATASDLAKLIRELKTAGFKGPFISCDVRPVSEAGSSEAQELAVAVASAASYLRVLEANGFGLQEAADAISFTLPIDAAQFEGTAKLRALRKLWARVQSASDLDQRPAHIHAETAWRMLTRRDPAVNMLRATMATFTAGIAGADSLTVLPHTSALGLPDAFSRRIARNTQTVLIEESNLWRVSDPAAGSGAIEDLTDELCQKAWAGFQEIEREGGLLASLGAGSLQGRITAVAQDRAKRLATRRDAITGTSEFPALAEADASVFDMSPGPNVPLTDPGMTIAALRSGRLAEPFEALRDAADVHTEKTGTRPAIFLANLGPVAEHTARATWIRNLVGVGGLEVISNEGFTNSGDVGKAFADSGVSIACICSNDANYELLGEASAQALKSAGAKRVYLAGKSTAELQAAGVDGFLHVGVDVLEYLHHLHSELGIDHG